MRKLCSNSGSRTATTSSAGSRTSATRTRWYTLESVRAWIGDEQHRFVILEDGAIAGMVALTGIERGAVR